VLEQNPGTHWTDNIGSIPVEPDKDESVAIAGLSDDGDELATFRL
jgi:hypothetical protein